MGARAPSAADLGLHDRDLRVRDHVQPLHLVVYVDQRRSKSLTQKEVVERWTQLFRAPTVVERWCNGKATQVERKLAELIIEKWRKRLCDLSWFMKCLNEHLARRANAEDDCDGRFWQGRFRSQALLDEAGLLTAMAYVDLNPVRAGIASAPEHSKFTSIYERIRRLQTRDAEQSANLSAVQVPLQSFPGEDGQGRPTIPFNLDDYLQLVDWTGRAVLDDKRGHIDASLPPIMRRLNIDPRAWQSAMQPRGNVFGRALGRLDHLRLHAQTLRQSWVRGLKGAERLFV